MTTHRVVLRKGPSATGTSGHGHRRAMTTDATGRRVTWWSCLLAGGGPCPDEPPRALPDRPCRKGHDASERFRNANGLVDCRACHRDANAAYRERRRKDAA